MLFCHAGDSIRFGLIEGKQLLHISIQNAYQSGWLGSNSFNVTILLVDFLLNVKRKDLPEVASGIPRWMHGEGSWHCGLAIWKPFTTPVSLPLNVEAVKSSTLNPRPPLQLEVGIWQNYKNEDIHWSHQRGYLFPHKNMNPVRRPWPLCPVPVRNVVVLQEPSWFPGDKSCTRRSAKQAGRRNLAL